MPKGTKCLIFKSCTKRCNAFWTLNIFIRQKDIAITAVLCELRDPKNRPFAIFSTAHNLKVVFLENYFLTLRAFWHKGIGLLLIALFQTSQDHLKLRHFFNNYLKFINKLYTFLLFSARSYTQLLCAHIDAVIVLVIIIIVCNCVTSIKFRW